MDESFPPAEFYKPHRYKNPIEPFIEDFQDPLSPDFKWIRLKPPQGPITKNQLSQFLDDFELGIQEIETLNHRERQLIANWLQVYAKQLKTADFSPKIHKEFLDILDHFLYLMYHVNHSSIQATLNAVHALQMRLGKK